MAEPPRSRPSRRGWWLVGALLLVPIVFPLIVPMYAREDPELFGIPFFYWYQFLWIVLAATMTSLAYTVSTRLRRRERAAREGRRRGEPR